MTTFLKELQTKQLITPPKWLVDNTVYLTRMGSVAYGVSTNLSDADVYGVVVPPLEYLFPHLRGEVFGFGKQQQRFNCWQEHHVNSGSVQYDFSVYNLVDYLTLLMDCNPNMIDSLFTEEEDVLHTSPVAKLMRDNRKLFLHKGAYYKFCGYAHSQWAKMRNKRGHDNPNRNHSIQTYGFDVKYGYHLVRLAQECMQILSTKDLNLKKDPQLMLDVRAGKVSLDELEAWFKDYEKQLESAFHKSTLPDKPNEPAVKKLLVSCLEEFYGDEFKKVGLKVNF